MRIADCFAAVRKHRSSCRILLFWVSPVALSLLIHLLVLYISGEIRWGFSRGDLPGHPPTATVVLEDPAKKELKFQAPETFERFKMEEELPVPPPDIDYRPPSPVEDMPPAPKVTETLDLISVPVAGADHSWMSPATGPSSIHGGSEKIAGSFSRHIQVLREGGLDVVFVFDATVSMARYLKRVKYKIAGLAETYKKLVPTCRIGMVAYRDRGEAFVTRLHPLTYGVASLRDFLNDIEAVGGGDREEAVEEALRVAVDEIKWNPKSKKIILLMGDAPPRKEAMPQALSLIKKFRTQLGGRLAALDTSIPEYRYDDPPSSETGGPDRDLEVMAEFKTFADLGGGECARLADEEKVVKQMLVLVFGARWQMYLDEFLKNL